MKTLVVIIAIILIISLSGCVEIESEVTFEPVTEIPDSDGDGRNDKRDVCINDVNNDRDGDGFCEKVGFKEPMIGENDNCPEHANPGQEDVDLDGIGDACDSCTDIDKDEICFEANDNCKDIANNDQIDQDNDGVGDACDTCIFDPENDIDEDSICGDEDNCTEVSNQDQADQDADGIGDACDTCSLDYENDADEDEVCGDKDNCRYDKNSDQENTDYDLELASQTEIRGNACDEDDDNDGKDDIEDNCPKVSNQNQEDIDQDSVGDVCDNCRAMPNQNQFDNDRDLYGNVCDKCPDDIDNDADNDTICNGISYNETLGMTGESDNCPAIPNTDQANADEDSFGDVCDICPFDSHNDADEDGVCGDIDNCPITANSDQADGDGDDVGNLCDPCPFDNPDDPDGDTICQSRDNCPNTPNNNQADGDGDSVGDACDPCPIDNPDDPDRDGVCQSVDNCPTTSNPNQADTDEDGVGDVCDPCPVDNPDDPDGDNVCQVDDNCPNVSNPDQTDGDGDRIGDVCDSCPLDRQNDIDRDEVCGDVDNCQDVPNTNQANVDDDDFGDVCDVCTDTDRDGRGNPGFPRNECEDDNCPNNANPDQKNNDLDEQGDICDSDDDNDGIDDAFDPWLDPYDLTNSISTFGNTNHEESIDPQVAINNNGDAIIVWKKKIPGTSKYGLFKSEYRDGVWNHPTSMDDALSITSCMNGQTTVYLTAISPVVAMDNNGDILITWTQEHPIATCGGSPKLSMYMLEYRGGQWSQRISISPSDDVSSTYYSAIAMSDNGSAVIAYTANCNGLWTVFKSHYLSL